MYMVKPNLPKYALYLLVFVIFFITLTLPSWTKLWRLWFESGSSYSHGPLIIAVGIWLFYKSYGALQSKQPISWQHNWLLGGMGLAASGIWSLGYLTSVEILQWLTLPIMAAALVGTVSAQRLKPAFAAPFIALYFALPVWELLVPPLQALAVETVSLTVKLVGIPAYIEGIDVTIPGGRFVVEGGCSGVRYLLVALALTSLWGFLHIHERKKALALVAFALILSILSNWLRIFIIVVIGYKTKMQSSIVHDHEFFGWILFAFTLIPILYLAVRLEKSQASQENALSAAITPSWRLKGGIQTIALISLSPLLAFFINGQIEPYNPGEFVAQFQNQTFPTLQKLQNPQAIANKPKPVLGGWKPNFSGIESWQELRYMPSGLEILLGHIPKQDHVTELFSSDNSFAGKTLSSQWLQTNRGEYLEFRNIYNQIWVARVFYRVGGVMTRGGIDGKIKQLKGITKQRADAQLIVIGFPCPNECKENLNLLLSVQREELAELIR